MTLLANPSFHLDPFPFRKHLINRRIPPSTDIINPTLFEMFSIAIPQRRKRSRQKTLDLRLCRPCPPGVKEEKNLATVEIRESHLYHSHPMCQMRSGIHSLHRGLYSTRYSFITLTFLFIFSSLVQWTIAMPSDNSTLMSPSIRRPVFSDLPEHNIERRYGGGHYYEEKPCKPKIIVKEVKVPYPVKVKETKIRTIKSKPQIIIKKVYVPKPIKVIKTVKVAVPKPIKVIKKVPVIKRVPKIIVKTKIKKVPVIKKKIIIKKVRVPYPIKVKEVKVKKIKVPIIKKIKVPVIKTVVKTKYKTEKVQHMHSHNVVVNVKKGKKIIKIKKKKKKKGKLKKWLEKKKEKKKKKKKKKEAQECHRRMGCSGPSCPFPIPIPFPIPYPTPTPTPTTVPPGQTVMPPGQGFRIFGKRRRKRGIFPKMSEQLAAQRKKDDDDCIEFLQNLHSPSSTSQRHFPSQSDLEDEDGDEDQEDKDEGQPGGVQVNGVNVGDVRDLMKEIGLGKRKFLG